jgi:TRAP-type transport system periplasmic protein
MKSNKMLKLFVFLVFTAVLAMPVISGAQDKVIHLRFSNFTPVNHPLSTLIDGYCKEIEKRTTGRVLIKHYPGNTITSLGSTYESVLSGLVDMAQMQAGYFKGRFPLSEIFFYPMGWPNGSVATYSGNEFYSKFRPKEFDEIKFMFAHCQSPVILHTTKRAVRKLEDMKGLKIRVAGPEVKLYTLLGAVPVAMPMGEGYDAMSKNVVEGSTGNYDPIETFKWNELVKYSTEARAVSFSSYLFVAMNKAKWNSIPPDLQKTIEEVNKEWIDVAAKNWLAMDASGKNLLLKSGSEIITLSPEESARWTEKANVVIQDYVKEMEGKNLPGAEVVKFMREYIKAHEK